MDKKVLRRPAVTIGVGLVGLALVATGVVLYPANDSLRAQVQSGGCRYDDPRYPTAPAKNDTWSSRWKLTDWLMYRDRSSADNNDMPIGAYKWAVYGKMRDSQGTITCYNETWRVDKAVRGSTRGGSKGTVIPHTQMTSREDGQLFTSPANYGGAGTADTNFKPNGKWDPVGLYGMLRDSKDDLNESRTYFPVEWVVEGELN